MRALCLVVGIIFANLIGTHPVIAADLAVIIGDENSPYRGIRNRPFRSDKIRSAMTPLFGTALRNAGFEVLSSDSRDMTGMLGVILKAQAVLQAGDVDNLIFIAAGPFANSGSDTWALSATTTDITSRNILGSGISVSLLQDLSAMAKGNKAIILGAGYRAAPIVQPLQQGIGEILPRERTVVFQGDMREFLGVVSDGLLSKTLSVNEVINQVPPSIRVVSNLASNKTFLGKATLYPIDPGASNKADYYEAEERGFWLAVSKINSTESYRVYLSTYPTGMFRSEAERKIKELKESAKRWIALKEQELNLSAADRAQVQRDLSLLGFDPRGIDGKFGKGSRGAIAKWQADNGVKDTGYLNAKQLKVLRAQSQRRAAELEQEAETKRLQEEQRDRAYWTSVSQRGTEEGMLAYLERYPQGLFATEARRRLARIERVNRERSQKADRIAWDAAVRQDNIAAYRRYLQAHPKGMFAPRAAARINQLAKNDTDLRQMALDKEQEAQFLHKSVARVLVEQRLMVVGFQPGPVDGKFDGQTRQAIRKFQRANRMPVTGYIGQATMVRLLGGR